MMRKLLLGTILLALASVIPVPTMAEVNVSIGISLPPPIVFQAPPDVIVMPDTNSVYVVPDIDADIYFWNGWWWRPWEGRWYRSHYYNRGWGYYSTVPSFYFDVDPGWRGYYRDHNWYGHRWNYERIPHQRLQQNWKSWHSNRHWERQKAWDVQGYKPRPHQQRQELRQQRREQYQRSPEVQRYQQQRKEQERQPRDRKPQDQKQRPPQVQQQQHRPEAQQPQREQQHQREHPQSRGQEHRGEPEHQRPQGRPEEGNAEHRR